MGFLTVVSLVAGSFTFRLSDSNSWCDHQNVNLLWPGNSVLRVQGFGLIQGNKGMFIDEG